MERICTPGGGNTSAAASSTSSSIPTEATSTETSGPARLCNDAPDANGKYDGKCSEEEKELYKKELSSLDILQIRSSFPYECRKRPKYGKGSVYEALISEAKKVCLNDKGEFDPSGSAAIRNIMDNISGKMTVLLQRECVIADGGADEAFWVDDWAPDVPSNPKKVMGVSAKYVNDVFKSNAAFAATVSEHINIQFGAGGQGAQTLSGTAAAMAAPNQALTDVMDNLNAKGWGACEVGTVKEQCEIMNALVSGTVTGDLAVYNPTTRQCELKPNYYQTVCQNFLMVSGFSGTAVWDPQNNECRIMPQ